MGEREIGQALLLLLPVAGDVSEDDVYKNMM